MGLDMYLTRKTYISRFPDEKWDIQIKLNGKATHIKPDRISYIEEEFGYWRKANAIHKWFVNNVQEGKDDCGSYYVSREKFEELKNLCERVLDNPKKAAELLSTERGFFFGGTDYDEHYMQDLKYTLELCQEILECNPKEGTFYYSSSW
jgi:hypothetical protein